jgi:hypothetical protein
VVRRLLHDAQELAEAGEGLLRRVGDTLDGLLDLSRGLVLDVLEDRLEDALLAAEVVVERALGDLGFGDDRVE